MKKTTYILGMAKSPLALKAGQARSLELDFFKLAFAVAKLRSEGHNAFGYLQVLAKGPQKRIECWIKKYGVGDAVKVLAYCPTPNEQKRLEEEKKANRHGLTGAAIGLKNGKLASDASYGKRLVELKLRCEMKERHRDAKRVKRCAGLEVPALTNWDYYGVGSQIEQ